MLAREFEYIDFDGNKRKETHYFHLSKAEVIEWLTTTGDYTLDKKLKQIANARNGKEVIKIFKELIYMSYGEKSLDGRRFIKTEEVKRNFVETAAYSDLLSELITDAKKASDFINAVIPKDLSDEITKLMAEYPDGIPDTLKDYVGNPDIRK